MGKADSSKDTERDCTVQMGTGEALVGTGKRRGTRGKCLSGKC